MRALILGPLEVHAAGRPVAMTARQRAIVVVLVLRAGTPTSAERLVDELWGDAAPATAIKSVQVRIAELRRVLPPGTLTSGPRGYLLAPVDVDADRFEALLAGGRPGAALALWRGEVLDGIDTPSVREEADAAAVVAPDRVRAPHGRGARRRASGGLVPSSSGSCASTRCASVRARSSCSRSTGPGGRPTRSRPIATDGRAWTRSGSCPAASCATSRSPSCARIRRSTCAGPAPAPASPPARRTRRTTVVTAVVVAAGLVAASLALLQPGGGRATSGLVPTVPADSLAIIDPAANAVTGAVPVGADPVAVAFGDGALWVADGGDQTVTRVDPRRRAVTGTFGSGGIPTAITADRGAVWVANGTTGDGVGTVSRVEPSTGIATTATVRPDSEGTAFDARTPSAVTVAGGSVWVNDVRRRLQRLAPDSGNPVARVSLGRSSSADGLTSYRGSIWAASGADDRLLRIDPASGAVRARITIAAAPGERVAGPSAVAGGFGSVWVTDTLSGTVSRIDPRLNAVTATIRVGARPTRIAAGDGAVWVLDAGRATVVRIDPRRDLVTRTIFVGGATDRARHRRRGDLGDDGGDPRSPRRAVPAGHAAPGRQGRLRSPGAGRRRAPDHRLRSPHLRRRGAQRRPSREMRGAIRRVLAQHGNRAGQLPRGLPGVR